MSAPPPGEPVYPGGIEAVLARAEGRRDPLEHAPGEGLPPLDVDLAPLRAAVVGDPDADPLEAPPFRSSYHRKRHAIRRELAGQSELAALNALLIAHLRKRAWPEHAPALFRRLWAEEGAHLVQALDPRWLVSSVTTFGDHGATAGERGLGLALATLFGAIKLYEFERLHSGVRPEQPFPRGARVAAPLPMEMEPYALVSGGLDLNLLARLWREAGDDPVAGPPARRLLDMLVRDPGTLFARLQAMRRAAEAPRSGPAPARAAAAEPARRPRWGLVATVKAPVHEVLRFAAHHLEQGAAELHLFLDAPDPEVTAALSGEPRIRVTTCDTGYWARCGKHRPGAHQLRQAWNASRAMRAAAGRLDWLGHVDVDELLLATRPVAEALAALPAGALQARVRPAEMLAPEAGAVPGGPRRFKLTHKAAGLPRSVLEEVYPTFGAHLDGGFLSHTGGKVLVRPAEALALGARFGVHALRRDGQPVKADAELASVRLGHLHAADWDGFRAKLAFRRAHGSYRARPRKPGRLGLAELLDFLSESEGEAGLRAFFEEVCRDTPALRGRLQARGMLVDHALDLDGAVARVFGRVPA